MNLKKFTTKKKKRVIDHRPSTMNPRIIYTPTDQLYFLAVKRKMDEMERASLDQRFRDKPHQRWALLDVSVIGQYRSN